MNASMCRFTRDRVSMDDGRWMIFYSSVTEHLMKKQIFILTAALIGLHSSHAQMKITAADVEYKSGDETIKGFLAKPEGNGPFPALIVIHEWWGLTDWVKESTKTLAQNGYVALAIDLYRGKVASDPDAAHQIMRGLPEDRAAKDLKAADAYLKTQTTVNPKKIGSIGWCMGGGYALQTAVAIPDLAACVINYGRLVEDKQLIRQINAPILGIFGALDKGILPADVKKFDDAAKAEKKDIHTIIYDNVGHGFINPNNTKGYNKERAAEAWKETWNFLDAHLKK
jgi:carboxymethylenebutenolidase